MSEEVASTPVGAGALLRAAREARHISLDHLASLLKVPQAKLAALEEDRHDALPGRAFVRSLAMSVARQLDIDAQPVLDALPRLVEPSDDLEHVTRGLATPFQMGEARLVPGLPVSLPSWVRPGLIGPLVLLVLAAGFWLIPGARLWSGASSGSGAAAEAASSAEFSVSTVGLASGALAASAPPTGVGGTGTATAGGLVAASGAQPAVVGSGSSITVAVPVPGAASVGAPLTAASGVLVVRAAKASWIEIRDAKGVLLSRLVAEGETVPLDGVAPFKLKIGNANAVELRLRGQVVDLVPATKDNVARLELP